MEKHITWILIADASKAKIYEINKVKIFKDPDDAKQLKLIATYTHAASRKKEKELITDKMGEFGSGSFTAPSSPKFQEAEHFAHELLSHLSNGKKENQFRDLILIAPPTFIGLINKYIPNELNKLVTQRIEKDYTQFSNQELLENLMQHL